jgi:type I site-specific restriction-modification system R (restriction) subunit
MQAIARANRFNEGKENGLIVDYCNILKSLRSALATFTIKPEGDGDEVDPTRPKRSFSKNSMKLWFGGRLSGRKKRFALWDYR